MKERGIKMALEKLPQAIYPPRGRAQEYCDLALNIYTGCNHGCIYCYAPKYLHKTKEEFHSHVEPRKNIVEATARQLEKGEYKDKKIMLCFTCDPYPADIDTTATREIIKLIKQAGAHVQILTKGGKEAQRDLDLLDSEDSFGVTISCFEEKRREIEPHAARNVDRVSALIAAHNAGIKTWVSCEPVYDTNVVYQLIQYNHIIDMYRIGKLNHMPSDINWAEFGRECESRCKDYGRNYYIKEDLRKEMEGARL